MITVERVEETRVSSIMTGGLEAEPAEIVQSLDARAHRVETPWCARGSRARV